MSSCRRRSSAWSEAGRSSTVTILPARRMHNASMTFLSSRTFPGQDDFERRGLDAARKNAAEQCRAFRELAQQLAHERGDIRSTVTQGRHPQRDPLNAIVEIFAKRPAETSTSNGRCVAQTRRTSASSFSAPPTRKNRLFAVDRKERSDAPRRKVMKAPSQDLFARAALTCKSDNDILVSDEMQHRVDAFHRIGADPWAAVTRPSATGGNASDCGIFGDTDMGPSGDATGGCTVGWVARGEWLEYDVAVGSMQRHRVYVCPGERLAELLQCRASQHLHGPWAPPRSRVHGDGRG